MFRVEGNDGIRDILVGREVLGLFTAASVPDVTARPESTDALLLTGADDEGVTV